MKQLRVAVFFGGVSSEHEISRVSAATILAGLAEAGYETLPVGITKEGSWWYYPGPPEKLPDGSWERDAGCVRCLLSPDRRDHGLWLFADGAPARRVPVDVAFPVLHGKNGEDGTIQGLFELSGIPYVGCGVLSSAVCMDKAVANALLDAAGVPRCEWDWAWKSECAAFAPLEARLAQKLGYPIFVKPANAGSSVGISKAHGPQELRQAIAVALREDDKVVFERLVEGQEVECAAIGNTGCGAVQATRPGEILAGDVFYTYDDKYKNGVSRTLIPAALAPEKLDEVRAWAEKAYQVLGCSGLARCDFFVEKGSGRVLVNEVNTLPGFTPISMYPQLMAAAGAGLAELVRRLVELALARAEARHG